MRNRIIGGMGALWGGAILVGRLVRGAPAGESVYVLGNNAAVILAVVMLIAGGYYFVKGGTAKT